MVAPDVLLVCGASLHGVLVKGQRGPERPALRPLRDSRQGRRVYREYLPYAVVQLDDR